MIMSNVKKQEQLKPVQSTEITPNVIDINLGQGDLRTIILDRILPAGADKWVNCLTNEELVPCYNSAFSVLEGSPFNQDSWNLLCGEMYDNVKDKVVEKQAYLVKHFNLVINDEEIKSEVDDYIKRKMN